MEFVGANSFARNCLNVRMNSHPHLLLFLGSGLGYYLDAPATVAKLRVSIPFHSGLGYYLRDSPCIRLFGEVSIPFHSGLGYYTTGEV